MRIADRAWLGASHDIVLAAAEKGSRDTSCAVRMYSAFALGRIEGPGAEAVLLLLLRDPYWDARNWAAFAVYLTYGDGNKQTFVYDTPEIREALLALTQDPMEIVRYEAFRSLGKLREKRAAVALERELRNEEIVYYDLVEAAGRIGDHSLIPVLEWIKGRFDDDGDIIETALEALRGT